ncbi:MAG TPA: tetratricopeptide repeat protein [Gemmatimonadales bacterium]|nr:tetratricopeptide repeat protein [Gemmatimonadales bacterium]
MYSTAQFRVFGASPSERRLVRARQLARDGRSAEAEDAYRAILVEDPGGRKAWGEYFEWLRSERRHDDALFLAERAATHFPGEAFALALVGAAQVELGRYRDGLAALERAAEADPDLGLVWHETGYAAWRLGESSRALLAVDRAFALDPHGATLLLRGKILRDAGRYIAAEVAFTGAIEAAEFPEQRREAERQVAIARRCAAFPGSKPATLPATRRWFAETGGAILTSPGGDGPPADADLLRAFADLAREEGWRFTAIHATDGWPGWQALARALSLALLPVTDHAEEIPLVVTRSPAMGGLKWEMAVARLAEAPVGMSFALSCPAEASGADVVGMLEGTERCHVDLAAAQEAVRHPSSRLAARKVSA